MRGRCGGRAGEREGGKMCKRKGSLSVLLSVLVSALTHQVRLGQVRSHEVKSVQVKSGQLITITHHTSEYDSTQLSQSIFDHPVQCSSDGQCFGLTYRTEIERNEEK